MSHPVNWFQIGGPNGHELASFYQRVFGWKMTTLPGTKSDKVVEAEQGGVPGSVTTTQNKQPSVAVYVSVGDIDAHFGKIEKAGGKIAMPKMDLPGGMGSIAGFSDPAGNWIGLWAAGKPAPKKALLAAKKKAGGAKKKAARPAKKKAAKKSKK